MQNPGGKYLSCSLKCAKLRFAETNTGRCTHLHRQTQHTHTAREREREMSTPQQQQENAVTVRLACKEEDETRLCEVVNWAYRGGPDGNNGWTTEAHLVRGDRTNPRALRAMLDLHPSRDDNDTTVGDSALYIAHHPTTG